MKNSSIRESVGIYPGCFDPLTLGHLDIIERAANLFASLIVAIGENSKKTPMLPIDLRTKLIKNSTQNFNNV